MSRVTKWTEWWALSPTHVVDVPNYDKAICTFQIRVDSANTAVSLFAYNNRDIHVFNWRENQWTYESDSYKPLPVLEFAQHLVDPAEVRRLMLMRAFGTDEPENLQLRGPG